MLIVDNDINRLIDKIKNYTAPNVEKWINKENV